jgi:hypothetical protein
VAPVAAEAAGAGEAVALVLATVEQPAEAGEEAAGLGVGGGGIAGDGGSLLAADGGDFLAGRRAGAAAQTGP